MLTKITKSLKTSVQDVNEKGVVTIQITQFDKYDSDNDRLLKGSLTKTWQEGKQVHLVSHKNDISTFVGLPISKDAESGIVESQLNLNKQVAIDLLEDYKFSQKHGRSLQHSHGFRAIKDQFTKNEKGGYDFKEVQQHEYSTVLFGAVSDTPLHGIKSETDLNEMIDLLEQKIKFCNYSNEYGKLMEEKIKELKAMIIEPEQSTQSETEAAGALQEKKWIFIN